jgi:hypothetical protein
VQGDGGGLLGAFIGSGRARRGGTRQASGWRRWGFKTDGYEE